MTAIEPGLYLRVEQIDQGPLPLPLKSGLSMGHAYCALGSTIRLSGVGTAVRRAMDDGNRL